MVKWVEILLYLVLDIYSNINSCCLLCRYPKDTGRKESERGRRRRKKRKLLTGLKVHKREGGDYEEDYFVV